MCDWFKEIPPIISAMAAAVAAYFSWRAIRENRKNLFLLDKNRVALAVNKIARGFESKYGEFNISEYLDEQATILSSKYYVSPDLYEKFITVLVSLHALENGSEDWIEKDKKANKIDVMIKGIECDIRLDEGDSFYKN